MISKELLSEILDREVINVVGITQIDSRGVVSSKAVKFETRKDIYRSINIYELAHKCKEWAYNEHGEILTSFKYKGEWIVEDERYRYRADTEPEAIFKACEWILKEMK